MKRRSLLSIVILYAGMIHADPITVYNHTNEPLSLRIYYQESEYSESGESASPVVTVLPNSATTIERPPRSMWGLFFFHDRNLFATDNASLLSDTLKPYAIKLMSLVNVGSKQGKIFHFARNNDGVLYGYNDKDWKDQKRRLSRERRARKGLST